MHFCCHFDYLFIVHVTYKLLLIVLRVVRSAISIYQILSIFTWAYYTELADNKNFDLDGNF